MANVVSPLLDLAMAMLPEQAIVARTANQLIRRGLTWNRGDKGTIRAAVKKTRPRHGEHARRLSAIIAEMERQDPIHRSRSYNQPMRWSDWRPDTKSRRRSAVYAATEVVGSDYGNVTDLRRVNGSVIYRANHYAYGGVVIFRPAPPVGPRQIVRVVASAGETIAESLHRAYAPALVSDALTHGRRVKLDFDRLATLIELANGQVTEVPWKVKYS